MTAERQVGDDRYRRTLDSLIEGFQIIGFDWTYLYVNPAAARHGQRRPDELIGRRMWDVYPEIRHSATFAVLSRCMTDRTTATLENQFTFPERTTRWFEIRVNPVPEGICVHSIDIEDRKRAEAERERMERQLRDQAGLASIGEMAAVLVHEVKNPLAAVRGAIQVIGGRVSAGDARIVAEVIARIDALNDHMSELLLFARPPQLRTGPVEVGALLQQVVALAQHDPSFREMQIEVAGAAPPILADTALLNGTFLNLLLNAAQATQGRGTIGVGVAHQDGFCVVEIVDDGPGIPPPVREKVFRPFFSTKPGGTGLGLANARRVVEEHGGSIAIECPESGGTRVIVRLPAAPRAALA
jgi:PAS domain S-box-containing protein